MKNPTVYRETCGTAAGYRAHTHRGEERCEPCKKAWTKNCDKYRRPTTPNSQVLIEEIEWLLKAHQGSHYILKAVGYTGREGTLRSRLEKHNRADLARRLLRMEDQAA